jgi:hypothetical protein
MSSIVEMDFGIVCACLPCMKPFAKRYFPNLFFFDSEFEQRVSSFRFSARAAARFSRSGGREDGQAQLADGEKVLRPKPSRSFDEPEISEAADEAGPSARQMFDALMAEKKK